MRRFAPILLAACGLSPALATAADLKLGDPAPKLEVAKFVKGKPVARFEPGTIYVVEFWATWCGPCRQTIPHLTELQKKYKDVVIIGVSVAETDPADVEPFVKQMGDEMDYRVAADVLPGAKEDEGGKMLKTWMEAADQDGIPTAFIIDKAGKVAWIGSPAAMDDTLDRVVSGKYDLQAEIAKGKEEAARRARLQALSAQLGKVGPKSDEAVALVDAALKDDPGLEDRLGVLKFRLLATRDDAADRAVAYGRHLVEDVLPENPAIYGGMAWLLIDPERPTKPTKPTIAFALELARKSDELAKGKDVAAADSLARALFLAGDAPKAVATQERAVKLAAGTEMEQDGGLTKRLAEYRQAAKAK